ncbi:MAG: GNAT family N-acetyltransferase [Clostridia bacterium]|nr:GNAT family N-acetyltransferase [Clostridia bacterium]
MNRVLTETSRLIIKTFEESMAQSVHKLSLDENNRRFQPDEVFETAEDALETIQYLSANYGNPEAPQVYPVILKDKDCNIGHVELVPIGEGEWEIGYHIGESFTRRGYASEAVKAFLPVIMKQFGLDHVMGICAAENAASRAVMEKCGFVKEYEGEAMYHGELRQTCRYRFT